MTPITHITPRESALERENTNMMDTINKQCESIQKLRKVVEMKDLTIDSLKADAERYQFIREGAFSGGWHYTEVAGDWSKGMDATIDKAMAAMKETKS